MEGRATRSRVDQPARSGPPGRPVAYSGRSTRQRLPRDDRPHPISFAGESAVVEPSADIRWEHSLPRSRVRKRLWRLIGFTPRRRTKSPEPDHRGRAQADEAMPCEIASASMAGAGGDRRIFIFYLRFDHGLHLEIICVDGQLFFGG